MVWCTKKNQNTLVFWFFFLSARWKGSNRAAAHSAASKATVRLCLARGFQRLGMSNVEAVNRKISWLFVFLAESAHFCTSPAHFTKKP